MSSRVVTIIAIAAILGCVAATPGNADSVVLYENDFSADPGWTTDQPANYFWDSGLQAFHATTPNAPPGAPAPPPPPATRYAYTVVEYSGNSMRLEFDLQPTDLQWSAAVVFGLFDADLAPWPPDPVIVPDANSVWVMMGRVDQGFHLTLGARGQNDVYQIENLFGVIAVGTWYHCVLEYLCSQDSVVLTVVERDSGQPVGTLMLTGLGGLPDDLNYLGFARDPTGSNCPGAGGFNCSASASANLDGVVLSEEDDLDGDGIGDDCDDDIDGDGVLNVADVCPEVRAPCGVDTDGRSIGDLDLDCDVDLGDFACFTQNYTGAMFP